MRLLVDQNVPRDVVSALRAEEHDVTWVQETRPPASRLTLFEVLA
jgi:hypothetical protein